jgi:uncharacterized protein (UPF0333 family)
MVLSKRGQSLVEYSILFAVVLSAILIMQFYIKRSYQGRLKAEADTVGQQYAPGHTTSIIRTATDSVSETKVEDGIQSVRIYGPGEDGSAVSVMEKRETVDSYRED